QLRHHLELVPGPAQVRPQDLVRNTLEVAERLVELDAQPELGRPPADLGRGQRTADEVVLEQLDAVEPDLRGRVQLLLQRAAQRDRRDRLAHGVRPLSGQVSEVKWRYIRSRSGVTPVKSSNAAAAWATTIPPPCSVRQPTRRAACSSSVSSGR